MSTVSRTEVENQIKALSEFAWFMPSQKIAYDELILYIESIHRVINLYGERGCGKTFLMHVLFKEKQVEYVPSPEFICGSKLPLVIDNAPFERTPTRGIRNEMRKYNLRHVIIVTQFRVEDSIPVIQLNITSSDIDYFRANLYRYIDIQLPSCPSLNLWEHLKLLGAAND